MNKPIDLNPPTAAFPHPTFPGLAEPKLVALLGEMRGWAYLWDGKIAPRDLQGPELIGTDENTGKKSNGVDCSGLVAWMIHHASAIDVPDGSSAIADWLKAHGLKAGAVSDGLLKDNVVRIFHWPETKAHAGHIGFIVSGLTIESYGHHGPGRRLWDPHNHWMSECEIYVAALEAA